MLSNNGSQFRILITTIIFFFFTNSYSEDGKVKVLAYNIHGWEPSDAEFEAVIDQSGAEILGLTEAWNANHNLSFGNRINYEVIFGGVDTPGQGSGSFNVGGYYMPAALMSKHPILDYKLYDASKVDGHLDPSSPVQIYRGALLAKIEVPPSDTVYVWVLHLNPWHSNNTNALRLEEITGVVNVLDSLQDYPVIIMGDFNMITREDIGCGLQNNSCDLESEFLVAEHVKNNGYMDSYRELHPDVNADQGNTNADGRIDYVFYNDKLKPLASIPLEDGVFGSLGYNMSDHLAQFAELEFLPRGPVSIKEKRLRDNYINVNQGLNQISLTLPEKKQIEVLLISAAGQTIKTYTTNSAGIVNFSTHQFESGIYFLKPKLNDRIIYHKLVMH